MNNDGVSHVGEDFNGEPGRFQFVGDEVASAFDVAFELAVGRDAGRVA